MSTSQPTDLTIDLALKILKSYDDSSPALNTESLPSIEELRRSLLLISKLSPAKNLGICADNSQQGFTALSSYLKAFGYSSDFAQEKITHSWEPVYLKFSTQKMSYYLDDYTGKYRGVLISCQTEDEQIAGTYGHFPLNLFIND